MLITWMVVTFALLVSRWRDFPFDLITALQRTLDAPAFPALNLVLTPIRRLLSVPESLTPAVSLLLCAGLVFLVVRGLWAAWDSSDRWHFYEGGGYSLSLEFWLFATVAMVSLEWLALVALRWPLAPAWMALLIAGFWAGCEAIWALRTVKQSYRVMDEGTRRLLVVAAHYGACVLVLWPVFAGMSRFQLGETAIVGWSLPPVSTNPPQFWLGVLIGWPVWVVTRLFGSAAIRLLRERSSSGAAPPAEPIASPVHQVAERELST